jgi:ribonuclease HI
MEPQNENQGQQVQGGIILDPERNEEIAFTWGLGETTNNQTKVLALLQGLMILKQRGINQISVIGDSTIIIHHMHYQTIPRDIQLRKLLNRVQRLAKSFESIDYFQVLRLHNFSVDK